MPQTKLCCAFAVFFLENKARVVRLIDIIDLINLMNLTNLINF